MFKKSFITRSYVMDVLKNNKSYTENFEGIVSDCNIAKDAMELKVPFSFVMGMFNYLSSLMHAANQIVIQEVVRQWFGKNHIAMIEAMAHSDDSVAKIYLSDQAVL